LEKQHLVNYDIKSHRVMVIGDDGEKLGEMSFKEAIQKAQESDLDLMQVGEGRDRVAICKILNYGAWKYHEEKRRKKQEFQNRAQETKSMSFRPVTDDNDFKLKIKKISEFLEKNHKVKIIIKFKGREGAMRELNEEVVTRIIDNLGEVGTLDTKISWSFKEINFVLKPNKSGKKEDTSSILAKSSITADESKEEHHEIEE
jgi:translation initiation factor IF-3